MKSSLLMFSSINRLLLLSLMIVACSPMSNINPKPEITITADPSNFFNESITGKVQYANPSLYSVCIYALFSDGWHSIMHNGSEIISIDNNNNWICETQFADSEDVYELAVFLIPNGYLPPVLHAEAMIPVKINLVASSKKLIIL